MEEKMTTHFESSAIRTPRGTKVGTLVVRYARAAHSALRAWNNRRVLTRTVGLMDDRMLADIGLTRSDVGSAFAEPLWRDPSERLVALSEDRRAVLQRRSLPASAGTLPPASSAPRPHSVVSVPRVKRVPVLVCDEAA
jgi:uncharacterized protein YjiS (DUF1127 family)